MAKPFLIISLSMIILFVYCLKSDFSGSEADRWEQRIKAEEILRKTAIHNNNLPARNLLSHIQIFLGTPHRMGGNSLEGTDCSGFVKTVFKESFEVDLPHNTILLFQETTPIHLKKAELGDLVFFSTKKGKQISHVGIYLHNYKFVHASSVNGVTVSDLKSSYYQKRFRGVGRVANINLNN